VKEPTVAELFDLSGKSALVTGGAGHLGGAICRALAEAGARVVVSSRDRSRAQAAAEALPGPASHTGVVIDHMDAGSIERGFQEAVPATGGLDILVNNANEPSGKNWRDITFAQFSRQLANAAGYFHLARLMRDHAVDRKADASIILLGSIYGMVGSYPEDFEDLPAASPPGYHALKGGIIHLTRHLAVYWAKDNVRVNCVSPGPFPTNQANPEVLRRFRPHSPLGRMGQVHELKGVMILLAGRAGSYITGQNFVVDGGWTAW